MFTIQLQSTLGNSQRASDSHVSSDRHTRISYPGTRKSATSIQGYFAWSCIPRGVPGLCERISQKHRCPATKLTFAYCSAVILNGKRHCLPITKEYLLFEYKDVFEGIGKLPGGPYRIQLKCDVQPVQHPPRQYQKRRSLL